jgi:putative colanic acid biosynthesis UDP-glucose lipid carrier transferase
MTAPQNSTASVSLVYDENVADLRQTSSQQLGTAEGGVLRKIPLTPTQRGAKRVLDLVIASLALIFMMPAMIGVAVLIRLDSPGPVLFRQRRIGLNGQLFQIYKFRTMTALDDGAVVEQARPGDSRVTRIGAILRRFSLDELPQLFNVLKGEMSLVGPRPHALAHDIEYSRAIASYHVRHKVKPGITGWAQVNGWRGATPELRLMIKRIEHDIWYIDHWSIWLDLKILVLTAWEVRGAPNAY